MSPRVDRKRLEQLAGELRLDAAEVARALDSERARVAIDADVDLADRIGQGFDKNFDALLFLQSTQQSRDQVIVGYPPLPARSLGPRRIQCCRLQPAPVVGRRVARR